MSNKANIFHEAIKCFHCHHVLVDPVMLPCGESLCLKHINDVVESFFFCVECGDNHTIPRPLGFPRNKTVEKIIATKIDKFEFGTAYTKAHKACASLEQTLRDLDNLARDPYNYVYEVVSELRNRVQLVSDEFKLKVDEEARAILDELNAYERKCRERIVGETKDEASLNDMLEMSGVGGVQLDEWTCELQTFESNEAKWDVIWKSCEKLRQSVLCKMNEFKSDLLLKKSIDFRINHDSNKNIIEMITDYTVW